MKMDEHGDEKHPIEGEVEYLLQDIQTVRYLKHENVVQMLDVVHIPHTQTRFPFSTVLLLMEFCVSSGLKFMNNQNMVHFDIKPKNILFRRTQQKCDLTMSNLVKHLVTLTYKIGDLGLCQTYDEGQPAVTTRRIGTEMYMSPEIAALGYKAGLIKAKPCDIYSLGVTLAFFVMQDQTFNLYVRNDKLLDYMESIENMSESQIPEGITRNIASIICLMIQRDPDYGPTIDHLLIKLMKVKTKRWSQPVRNQWGKYKWYTFNWDWHFENSHLSFRFRSIWIGDISWLTLSVMIKLKNSYGP